MKDILRQLLPAADTDVVREYKEHTKNALKLSELRPLPACCRPMNCVGTRRSASSCYRAAPGYSEPCGDTTEREKRTRMRRINAGTSIISTRMTITVVSGSPMAAPRFSVAMAIMP